MREYDLSSQEGVALMCLAEALLRIPDRATRDALIRDKIGGGDWRSHVGRSASLFVNAATWGLVVTGKLTATATEGGANEGGLAAALTRLTARGGEPVIRKVVDMAMRLMGEQFVTGQTIEAVLRHARTLEARGFRHSYDMLGEAATTAEDALRHYRDYEAAIHAIGRAAAGRGIYEGPGISIKLSALHPRPARPRAGRAAAAPAGVGADGAQPRPRSQHRRRGGGPAGAVARPAQALCFGRDLAGWDGIGFVVQA